MKPIDFKQKNKVLKAPEGYTEKECGDLPVYIGETDSGHRSVLSVWKPDEADRKRIAFGGPIYLAVFGSGMPPVALFTEPPFVEERVQKRLFEHDLSLKAIKVKENTVYCYPKITEAWTLNSIGRKPFYEVKAKNDNKIELTDDQGKPRWFLESKFTMFQFTLD